MNFKPLIAAICLIAPLAAEPALRLHDGKEWKELDAAALAKLPRAEVTAKARDGNTDAAIVYKTDAAISKKVKVAWTVPLGEAPAVIYPVAICTVTKQADEAKRFADFLKSDEAKKIFKGRGFGFAAQ